MDGPDGTPCPHCDGQGELALTACPLDVVPDEAWRAVGLADLYEKGLPPVAGGALDQAATFVEAAAFIAADKAAWKAKLKIWP